MAQLIDEVTNEVDEEVQQEAVSENTEEVAVDDTPSITGEKLLLS